MNQDRPGGQKPMNSYVISDLEVCGLEDSKFSELAKAYTTVAYQCTPRTYPSNQRSGSGPTSAKSPARDRSGRRPTYRSELFKAMEPWHVINSRNGGPYAVKTAIGWVVNDP
ncbi:hypothetical protein AAFF_G00010000 [Aldrovandia affinis]|uniref:Uncharacterized protein n=1 Tax=Aldrovandia affinis TaxID=143900 RepID=A0AAD7S9B7_9TELE|nr:hypothetical protein AAFF_G00010000 [Aldrovandia affinis]